MYKILSIDGGGIRGLIPTIILDYIETKVKKPLHKVFDLLAGTSTGGIIALGIAKEYEPKQLIKLYEIEGKKIFKRRRCYTASNIIDCILNIGEEKYKISNLEEVMNKYFEEYYLKDVSIDVIVPSYKISQGEPYFFKSKAAKLQPDKNYLIKDVACATAAAPTYFEPYGIKTDAYIDGGVFANNPAMCAFAEALKLGIDTKEILIVSLGTGNINKKYNYNKVRNWGTIHWARPVIDIGINGQSQAADYQLKRVLRRNYYRLQPEITEDMCSIDNVSDEYLEMLKKIAQEYIENNKKYIYDLCNTIK